MKFELLPSCLVYIHITLSFILYRSDVKMYYEWVFCAYATHTYRMTHTPKKPISIFVAKCHCSAIVFLSLENDWSKETNEYKIVKSKPFTIIVYKNQTNESTRKTKKLSGKIKSIDGMPKLTILGKHFSYSDPVVCSRKIKFFPALQCKQFQMYAISLE